MRRRPHPHLPRSGVAAAAALALAPAATGCSHGAATESAQAGGQFAGAALPAAVRAPDFLLRDQGGRAASLAQYRGRVVVLAFVYTGCGAPCVLIAQQVRGALDELPRAVPVLFVSVDPAADSPARVQSFLTRVSLGGRVRYLSGSRAQLAAVWRAYHVVPPSAGRAAFAHAAFVVLVDGRGRERVLYGQEQLTPEALAHDIRVLQSG